MTDNAALDPTRFAATPAEGRDCGACTLCCKVFDVPSLSKPMGKWCLHCRPGRGCGIHETRPEHCRAFFCAWMTESWLGPEWKPDRAKFVLTIDPATQFLLVQLDPGAPTAWKQPPYYAQFKRWAEHGMETGKHVIVFLNRSATVVLPTEDVEIGVIGPGERMVTRRRNTPFGPRYDIIKQPAQG